MTSVGEIFDTARLESAMPILHERLRRYLDTCYLGESRPSGEDLEAIAKGFLEQPASAWHERWEEILDTAISHARRIHDPRVVGHQVAPPHPLAFLTSTLVACMNQSSAVNEMGPFVSAAERALIAKLCETVGWREGEGGGVGTHGGTLANLTALLTARSQLDQRYWRAGTKGESPAILVSESAHYSIERAAGIMGIGTDAVVKIPLDASHRLDVGCLSEQLDQCRRKERRVLAVVASAPSTPLGAIDPLVEVAQVCQEFAVWMHVDAAHGASCLFSDRLGSKLAGIEKADSITWDAHKMMHVPSLCAFVLYRDASMAAKTFQTDASYLFNAGPGGDLGLSTLECTKAASVLPAYVSWSVYGPQFFAEVNEYCYDLAHDFHDHLCATDDFAPVHRPDTNILAFKYVPVGRRVDQAAIRSRVLEQTGFHITQTTHRGETVLRVTLTNPQTKMSHLKDLLHTIRSLSD